MNGKDRWALFGCIALIIVFSALLISAYIISGFYADGTWT